MSEPEKIKAKAFPFESNSLTRYQRPLAREGGGGGGRGDSPYERSGDARRLA